MSSGPNGPIFFSLNPFSYHLENVRRDGIVPEVLRHQRQHIMRMLHWLIVHVCVLTKLAADVNQDTIVLKDHQNPYCAVQVILSYTTNILVHLNYFKGAKTLYCCP